MEFLSVGFRITMVSVKAIELLTALNDDAMLYASFLPSDLKSSFSSLGAAMANIFGDHGYPEAYRQELHSLKKLSRETIQEYASRVEMLVRKYFPTIDTTDAVQLLCSDISSNCI
jgi:hypothetical protein